MKLMTFQTFILFLTVAWMQFYAEVRETFNGVSDLRAQLTHHQKLSEKRQLAFDLDREQFLEFRQNVATLMPDMLKENGLGEEGYPYRNLASVVTKSTSDSVRLTIAKTVFEKAKENFRAKDYPRAVRGFKQVIERFGYASFVPESYFLMSESHFQANEMEECTDVIKQMVELFPSHELTGLALVRLGRIYEIQNRNEEAVDIYKTVLRSYPQRDVASQAKASLRGMNL